jgi:transcriptional antiterminator RfaH
MSQPLWYVVQTQPHAERKAAWHLARQGFKTYLPRYLKRRRHARRTENIGAALFPRYLFVSIDLSSQRWRSILSTVGVVRLVCYGDHPAAVPHGIVEALKAREDADGYVRLDQRPRFRPGDGVRVEEGAFAANLAVVENVSDHDRVTILLDLLGRKVRVSVEAELLTAA